MAGQAAGLSYGRELYSNVERKSGQRWASGAWREGTADVGPRPEGAGNFLKTNEVHDRLSHSEENERESHKKNMTQAKLKPPGYLSAASKRLFRSICESFEIDEAAKMVLVATLEAKDRREQARAAIAKNGAVYADRFGQLKPSPWAAIERDAATTLMRGFRLLGFDQEQRGDLGIPR
jgi:phage terminase small subunit